MLGAAVIVVAAFEPQPVVAGTSVRERIYLFAQSESDADTMFAYIAPKAKKPLQIALLTKPGCPFCKKVTDLLQQHGLA